MPLNTPELIGLALPVLVSAFWCIGLMRAITDSRGKKLFRLPSVSVIVAARNEEEYIEHCLNSILAVDYPDSLLEIILVDDHSADHTLPIAKRISAQTTLQLKILSAPQVPDNISPKKNAICYGITNSMGEILFFTDADSSVPVQWIKSMLSFYDEKTGAVAGMSLPRRSDSWLYRLERILVNYTSVAAIGWQSPASVCGQNFSYRRAAFKDCDGMPYREIISGDDDLLAQQIARKGWKVKFALIPETIVGDLRRTTFSRALQSVIRHQSTANVYPKNWQIIYSLSVLANLIFIATACAALINSGFAFLLLLISTIKFLLDGAGFFFMKKKLAFQFSFAEFLFIEMFSPLYISARATLLLASRFSWQNRHYAKRFSAKPKPIIQ